MKVICCNRYRSFDSGMCVFQAVLLRYLLANLYIINTNSLGDKSEIRKLGKLLSLASEEKTWQSTQVDLSKNVWCSSFNTDSFEERRTS